MITYTSTYAEYSMHAHSQVTSAQLIIQGHTTTMEMVFLLLLLSQEVGQGHAQNI